MKRQNFKLFGTLAILVGMLFSYQSVFGDILIRKDNTDPGTQPNVMSIASTITKSSKTNSSAILVEADVHGSNLVIEFDRPVGTAYLSVVDQDGNVVAFEIIDTFSDDEAVISLDGLSKGNYNLKISYGSTRLIGTFHYK